MDTSNTQALINQYLQGLNTSSSPLDMVTADTGNYLQNQFFQTPGYQLLYGQNDNSLDPLQRFQGDPSYQFTMQQGMNQLAQQGSAQGLIDSGNTLQNETQYSQNYANQNYQTWLNQQNSLFNNYQNQLSGLVTAGTANNGSQAALSTGSQIASTNAGLASSGAAATQATGSNVSSLLANQGSLGASAYLNTAAAESNNLLNGASLTSQINAQNSASQAGSMNSLFSGLGQQAGSGKGLFGGMF